MRFFKQSLKLLTQYFQYLIPNNDISICVYSNYWIYFILFWNFIVHEFFKTYIVVFKKLGKLGK